LNIKSGFVLQSQFLISLGNPTTGLYVIYYLFLVG